jgi:phage-related protein
VSDEMTEQEKEEHDRISKIEDFLEWHLANSAFWTKHYHNHS